MMRAGQRDDILEQVRSVRAGKPEAIKVLHKHLTLYNLLDHCTRTYPNDAEKRAPWEETKVSVVMMTLMHKKCMYPPYYLKNILNQLLCKLPTRDAVHIF